MALGRTADILLYAPFVGVYEVPYQIRKELTIDEFFGKDGCYVEPHFDGQIEKLSRSVVDDMKGDDWPLKISEMVDSLKAGKNELEALQTWLKTGGDGVFTILGDAGTGKSTFIHHLQWSQKDIQWHILDLKKAIAEIAISGSRITFQHDDFASLHGKILSSVILEIRNLLFTKAENNSKKSEAYAQSRKTIQLLLQRYEERIADETPLEEYARLYEKLREIEADEKNVKKDLDYCKACAKVFTKYFNEQCCGLQRNRDAETLALRCALTHLLIVLRCLENKDNKNIVVFDNIERFIGADEIYNKELTDFLGDMRNICDNYRDEYMNTKTNINTFAQKFQFIISMRNTTVRNHPPAENSDYKRHTIDLSSWFAIDEIIHAKLCWYEEKKIEVTDELTQNHLEYILRDLGVTTDQTLRGLKPKLDLFFNYNKRLIISFLMEVLEERTPAHYMEAAHTFYEARNESGPVAACARFGYRSVIWRRVLDWLRKGDLFKKEIFGEYATPDGRISATNYIWKLLIVLHRFSVDAGGKETESRGTEGYMPFLDLIKAVYNEQGDFSTRFYEDGFSDERERMARLLFYMNYYNRNENNWFQFIDIQYNVESANRTHLTTWSEFQQLLMKAREDPTKLKIRITTAGKAYLGYVAPSFEFVSCMAGKLPLLCCLPTEEELRAHKPDDQKCIQIIRGTINEMKIYISDAQRQADNRNLLYQRTADVEGRLYAERLVNSTFGYLTNFIDCVDRLVTVTDETAQKNKAALIKLIVSEAENLQRLY